MVILFVSNGICKDDSKCLSKGAPIDSNNISNDNSYGGVEAPPRNVD